MEEGAKRDRRTPQEASRGAQKGPQSSQNEPQRVQNWERKGFNSVLGRNVRKTSKSTTLSSEKLDFLNDASRKSIKNCKEEGIKAIKRADEAPRSPEGAKMSPKESPKGAQRRLTTDLRTDFGAGRPPGAPSRAQGILDKSNNERIKESIR